MSRSLVPIQLPADPTQPLEAATKQYVDNSGGGGLSQATADTLYVNVGGDTMTGTLSLSGDVLQNTAGLKIVGRTLRAINGGVGHAVQVLMGYSGTENNCHAIETAHSGGTIAANSLRFRLWQPGDPNTAPTNTVVTMAGDGVTFAKPVTLAADPVNVLEAVTKQYADAKASGAGPLFGFNFSTTTTAPPASATVRLNNATPASATAAYVHYTSKDGVDLRTRILAGTVGDRLYIQDRDASANYRMYSLTAAPTDNTTYATLAVTHQAGGGTITDAQEVVVGFLPTPITVSNTAPAAPLTGDLWIDTT